jgi:hypothetical protein
MTDEAVRAFLLMLGLFCGLSGLAFFVVGLAPGRSAPWFKQYAYSAATLTAAFYLIRYALAA